MNEMNGKVGDLVRKLDAWLAEQKIGQAERDCALAMLAGFYAGQYAHKTGADVRVGVGILSTAMNLGAAGGTGGVTIEALIDALIKTQDLTRGS